MPGAIRRAGATLAGLAAVAAAMAWATAHPPRPRLEVVGDRTFRAGTVPPGAAGRHPWTLRNTGTAPVRLRIRFTSPGSGFSLWQGQEHVIGRGTEITAHLAWSAPGRESAPFERFAILRTDDPSLPEFRLVAVGTTGPDVGSPAGVSPGPAPHRQSNRGIVNTRRFPADPQ